MNNEIREKLDLLNKQMQEKSNQSDKLIIAMNQPRMKETLQQKAQKRFTDPLARKKTGEKSKEVNSRPEVKNKQRKAALGRTASEETKEKMTATRTGKKHKDTTIAKMTKIFEGTNILTGEKIIAHGTKEIRELGFSQSMVSECVNGKRDSCKGYTWKKIISHNYTERED